MKTTTTTTETVLTNFRDCTGVKGKQFETGNIWSETSPYPDRRRYLVLGSPEESRLWKRKRWFVVEILAACATVQSRQRICLVGCPRTWTVVAMSGVKSVAAATNISYELIENNTFKNNTYCTTSQHLQTRQKMRDLRSQCWWVSYPPSRCFDTNICVKETFAITCAPLPHLETPKTPEN